jgi:hypothetical protein
MKNFVTPFFLLMTIILLIATLFVAHPVSAQNLINAYEFNGNFVDSLGNGNPLVEFNTNTSGFGAGEWWWTANTDPGGGLILTTPIPNPQNYSIGIRVEYDEVGPSWRKIISFLTQSDDEGLYFNSGDLNLYSQGAGINTYNADTFYDIIFTRDSLDNVNIYIVDGGAANLEISLNDSSDETVPNSVPGGYEFRLFHDDSSTDSEWSSGGTVRSIRIWDGPLPPLAIATAMDAPLIPPSTAVVPTITEWGMITFMILAGLGSFYYLRRRKIED